MERSVKELLSSAAKALGALSSTQRLAAAVVMAIVLTALGTLFYTATSGPSRGRAEAAAGESQRSPLSDLNATASSSGSDLVSWLFEGSGWLESPEKFDAKLLHTKLGAIERAILWNEQIQKARIVLHRGHKRHWLRAEPEGSSAAVMLRLANGVARLTSGHARSIRSTLQSAFALESSTVSITDHRGNIYSPGDDASAEGATAADGVGAGALRRQILQQVSRFFAPLFNEDSFVVGVNVYLSRRTSKLETEAYDADSTVSLPRRIEFERQELSAAGGLGAAPTLTSVPSTALRVSDTLTESRNVRTYERSEEENFPGRRREITDVPAGEVEAVSVNVLIDRNAVERLVGVEGATLSDYLTRQERFIERSLPYPNTRVTVAAESFSLWNDPALGPPPMVASEASVPPPIPSSGQAASAWAGRWWPTFVGGALFLVAIVTLAFVLLRNRAAMPDADEIEVGIPLGAGLPVTTGGVVDRGRREGLFQSLDDTSRRVEEKPEVAASVLRLWLAQDSENLQESSDERA